MFDLSFVIGLPPQVVFLAHSCRAHMRRRTRTDTLALWANDQPGGDAFHGDVLAPKHLLDFIRRLHIGVRLGQHTIAIDDDVQVLDLCNQGCRHQHA
jgi:hypothetical protein